MSSFKFRKIDFPKFRWFEGNCNIQIGLVRGEQTKEFFKTPPEYFILHDINTRSPAEISHGHLIFVQTLKAACLEGTVIIKSIKLNLNCS